MGLLALCRYIYWVYVKQRVVLFIVFEMLLSVLKLNDFLEGRDISVWIWSICESLFNPCIVGSMKRKQFNVKEMENLIL